MISSRGPEYTLQQQRITVPEQGEATMAVRLERWIDPREYGFYGGDHHIHAAGCAHYTSPTEGVRAEDMFLQVKGEGLHVGCILTWGPCYDYQRQFFEATPNRVSDPVTLLKYDVEVSGFGSQALGHVCLLGLKDQTYPGSDGTTKGWPTWTTPVLRWAKAQGAVTGYAHSASGLAVDPAAASRRLLEQLDANKDGALKAGEAAGTSALLPEDFATIDADKDGTLTVAELEASHQRAVERLPNVAIPEMNGVGAQEICVTVAAGALRLHQRHGHPPDCRVELLVPSPELWVPAEGQRRDRLPVHERHPRRPGAGLRAARQGRCDRLRRLVPGHRGGAFLRLRRLCPRLEFTVDGKPPGRDSSAIGPAP